MCTHNLCFGSKVRKIGVALFTPFLLYKRVFTFQRHVFLMTLYYTSSDAGKNSFGIPDQVWLKPALVALENRARSLKFWILEEKRL